MPAQAFEAGMHLMDGELAALKRCAAPSIASSRLSVRVRSNAGFHLQMRYARNKVVVLPTPEESADLDTTCAHNSRRERCL
ncbi:MAG: hypothetical protein ACREV7_03480 [Steroidobacteraceae bacterium]